MRPCGACRREYLRLDGMFGCPRCKGEGRLPPLSDDYSLRGLLGSLNQRSYVKPEGRPCPSCEGEGICGNCHGTGIEPEMPVGLEAPSRPS